MNDKSKVNRAFLPSALICDNSIINDEHSCEEYLTEYVNCSQLFLSLSEGGEYIHIPPKKQNNGQYDCRSDKYSVDFKILGTNSSLYARRNLSLQHMKILDGVISTVPPIQFEGMQAALVNELLKTYSYMDLMSIGCNGYTFDRNNLSIEYDVQQILKTVHCYKNILLFHSDYYFSEVIKSIDEIANIVLQYQNECLGSLFAYREKTAPGYDTFLACIIEQYFCIGRVLHNKIDKFEKVPLVLSKSFLEITEYLSSEHKKRFGVE